MAKLPIFTEAADGRLVRMKPSAPPNEDSLQELIAKFPEVIAGNDENLLLVRREQSVPDMIDGNSRWSLDHLFVTRGAVPVLVEVKRAVDTRLRREVIGQILDYAAHGVAYWSKGTLAEAFALTGGENANDILVAFLGSTPPEDFWEQVDANLSAGRIRLVIAADIIPKELARVVEFLNEQMEATVLAVELNYYSAEDGRRTLAPRIIGETARTNDKKSGGRPRLEPISMSDWIAKHLEPRGAQVLAGAKSYLGAMEDLQAELSVSASQGSIASRFTSADGKILWPLFLNANGTVMISFGWVSTRPALLDEGVRRSLLSRFDEAVAGISTQNTNGFPSFPVERLNDPEAFKKFRGLAQEFVDAAKQA